MENIPPLYLPSKNAKNAAIGDVYAILALLYGVIDKLYASFNLSLTNFVVCNSFVVLDIYTIFRQNRSGFLYTRMVSWNHPCILESKYRTHLEMQWMQSHRLKNILVNFPRLVLLNHSN